MKYFKTVKRLTMDDLSELFTAIARFPYFGGFLSLLSALYDLYDIVSSIFNRKLLEKKTVISIALSRLCGHTLIGLGGLVPLISIATFMLIYPCVIPLVAFYIASAELYKFCKIANSAHKIVLEDKNRFAENLTPANLNKLKESREMHYQSKQECIINVGLLIGATLGVVGLLFPPLLTVGIIISLTSAVMGIIDKKYRLSEKLSYFIFGNQDVHDEKRLKIAPLVMKPLKRQKVAEIKEQPRNIVHYPSPAANKHPARFFYTQPETLSVAPALVEMRNYHIIS